MFKNFFKKRIEKDISKLEEARVKCISVMQNKGMSDEEISQVEGISHKKASVAYVDNPNVQAALQIYFKSLVEEAKKIGYDIS